MLKACNMRRSGQEVKPNDHSRNVYYQLIYEHTINDTYECSKFLKNIRPCERKLEKDSKLRPRFKSRFPTLTTKKIVS